MADQAMIQHEQLEKEMFQRGGILVGSGMTQDPQRLATLNSNGHLPQTNPNTFMCVPNITYKSILPA